MRVGLSFGFRYPGPRGWGSQVLNGNAGGVVGRGQEPGGLEMGRGLGWECEGGHRRFRSKTSAGVGQIWLQILA